MVVIFATQSYSERRFCRLEMRLALASGDAAAMHLVLALGAGSQAVLDELPAALADQSWPAAEATERLAALVRQRLAVVKSPIRSHMTTLEAQRVAAAFLEETKIPQPQSLDRVICSLPPGVTAQSIGTRFVGRADDLRSIHRVLSGGGKGTVQTASRICAGGGFGKTRLVMEYVHRYGPQYYPGGIFWVNAEAKALDAEFWRVLQAIDPRVPDQATMLAQKRNIRQELELALRGIARPALFLVDGIPEAAPGEDPPGIAEFCPALGAVTVLATSRQDTHEAGVITIHVDVLAPEAAKLLLTENVPGASELTWDEWGNIADWVGNLPLALDLLNRSLALNSISPRDLARRANPIESSTPTSELDSLCESLRGQVPESAARGITEAFSISFEKLDYPARSLAGILARLASAPIPEEFIAALGVELRSGASQAALRSRHFVTTGEGLSFGVMHRLMGDFLRRIMPETAWFVLACDALLQVMDPERCRDPRYWPLMNICRVHAEELLSQGVTDDATAMLLIKIALAAGILASAQGDDAVALELEERVVEMSTVVLGDEHPATLVSMGNYASTLANQGDLDAARELQVRVLEVSQRVLGDEDPSTLTAMSNLASTLSAQGEYAGARQLEERLLDMRTRLLGAEHSDTLTTMNNLAETLSAQGDFAGARRLQEKAFDLFKRLLGEEHPATLNSMNNLAETLSYQGDFAGAQRLHERVLKMSKRLLGDDHPATLRSMGNLADTLREQGDLAGARQLHERRLEASKRVLGEEHPATLAAMNNLAVTIGEQGDRAGARRLQEQVLEALTRQLGEEHPDTLTLMNNLAETLSAQGDLGGARRLHERVLEMYERVLGEEHPATLRSIGNLAHTLRAQGDLEGARRLHERKLEASRRVLGEEHPATMTTMNNLALILGEQGDYAGARRLQERVLEISTHRLGDDHPDTLTAMNNLALTLFNQGELKATIRLLRRSLAGHRKVFGDDYPDTADVAEFLRRLGG